MSGPDFITRLAPWPEADFSAFGETDAKPLTKIQQLTGAFLGRNWVAIPHVTHHDLADITGLETRRQAYNKAHPGQKLTPPVLIAKALVAALAAFPQFNASLDGAGKTLFYKKYFHIGFAVDTARGLLVPVIRDCDKKTAGEIAAALTAVAEKAKTKGLSIQEMSGGCITISSLGHIGGTAFTPIINAPELAILGVTRTQLQPVPGPDGSISWRQMLPLSLSYDHRVINGADAARFTRFIADQLDSEAIFS
jgi:pyruvate dehydrogenase E2 component (dihydrolipoamide acetyltransferase)